MFEIWAIFGVILTVLVFVTYQAGVAVGRQNEAEEQRWKDLKHAKQVAEKARKARKSADVSDVDGLLDRTDGFRDDEPGVSGIGENTTDSEPR